MRRLVFALVLSVAAPAWARSEKTLAYTRDQAWPAAVRFLRVDEHLTIVEKDADAGYVLFELHEEGKTFHGSLELATVQVEGRAQLRLILSIEDRPSYVELTMLGRLERKLRAELGAPLPPPPKKDPEPPPPPKDAPKPDPPPA
jgi:hypothetical protein